MLTKNDIEKYFLAEKQESLLFLGIGIAAIILSIIGFFIIKTSFWKGAAFPLIIVGLMQIVVGFTVYNRSDEDRKRVVYAYDLIPSDLKNKELPRMVTVNKKFVLYRYAEIALVIIGILLIIKYKNNNVSTNNLGDANFWLGLGTFLAIQALLMLGADFFAEKRALIYTKLLQEFKI